VVEFCVGESINLQLVHPHGWLEHKVFCI